ncbi:hypothetical protein CPB84DRAFT_1758889 [Gymnopilus junonius]|uniref:1-acyl-sn-glycerol-3-phosphate acyltransferase n=1 Tax=Gymnopilus junonius TaxID=109634 RepID=A0A9P5P3T0_GYMJU|nr:hypothetical protein CPB84DRAFT_1758889 [Gymnopilus junonius]
MSFLVSVFKPLAYISLPLILIRQIAVTSTIGRYYARVVVYVGTLMTVASCSIVVAVGMSLIGRSTDVNYFVARIFYAITSRALDLKIEVEGEEHLDERPAVLMANHQSMLDILVVGRLMPKQTAIMAKKSLQFTPLGPFMSLSGTIFIDRGNNARAIRSIDAAGESMRRFKTSLWMFPEGTRHLSKEPDLLPLKKGGFHLAINAGIPITPIVTENYWHMYRKGIFESGTIKVRVLPPIPTTGLTVDDMMETLNELSRNRPSESKAEKTDIKPKDPSSAGSSEGAEPLESAASPSPLDPVLQSKGSSSSIASSAAASGSTSDRRKLSTSEAGTETEEDEGMVLVGRPH